MVKIRTYGKWSSPSSSFLISIGSCRNWTMYFSYCFGSLLLVACAVIPVRFEYRALSRHCRTQTTEDGACPRLGEKIDEVSVETPILEMTSDFLVSGGIEYEGRVFSSMLSWYHSHQLTYLHLRSGYVAVSWLEKCAVVLDLCSLSSDWQVWRQSLSFVTTNLLLNVVSFFSRIRITSDLIISDTGRRVQCEVSADDTSFLRSASALHKTTILSAIKLSDIRSLRFWLF